jgi:transposase
MGDDKFRPAGAGEFSNGAFQPFARDANGDRRAGDGFWLYFKRLEKGHFRWPAEGADPTMELSSEELAILLGGAKVERKPRRDEVTERVAV